MHILLVFTILMSLSGIDKVLFLSYTAVTNSQKAAHFCSCATCNIADSESGEVKFCHTAAKADNSRKFCHTDSGDHSKNRHGSSVCSCNSNSGSQTDAVVFNNLDKVAFLQSYKVKRSLIQISLVHSFKESLPSFLLKEVFRPPKI